MEKWELARYLIDAKKSIDSIMYIKQNHQKLNINLREKITEKRNKFYINCCVILDYSFKSKRKLIIEDEIAKNLYYERDKNSAHEDRDYEAKRYEDFKDLIKEMKIQLRHVKKICSSRLPEVLTLDFMAHDAELFRLVNRVSKKEEEEIKDRKVKQFREWSKFSMEDISMTSEGVRENYFILEDTEDIKGMDDVDKEDGIVVFSNGINEFETTQRRQDDCIKMNVLHKQDLWVTPNKNIMNQFKNKRDEGVMNQFDEIIEPPINALNINYFDSHMRKKLAKKINEIRNESLNNN